MAARAYQNYNLWKSLPVPYLLKTGAIYAIVNRDNGKVYIGSALRFNHRLSCHRSELEKKEHGNVYLQKAFLKSPESFYVEVIEELGKEPPQEKVIGREQFWMDFYRSHCRDFGYNISPTAGNCQGIKQRPETLAKLSKARKGRKWTEEQKARFKIARQHVVGGWKWSKESKERQRKRVTGSKRTVSWIENHRKWMRENRQNSKPIIQFTTSGEFVSRFNSISDAERQFGKRSNIHAVCKGKRPVCLGFKWKYELGGDDAK